MALPAMVCALVSSIGLGVTGSPPLPPTGLVGEDLPLCDSTVLAIQQEILGWYLFQGYPFARVGLYLAGPDSMTAAVAPGRHAELEEVRFEGLEDTDPRILSRLLRLEAGEPYDPGPVERWQSRLSRLPFLERVGPHALVLGPMGGLVIVQEVVEGPSGSFAASFGFAGSGGSEEMEGAGDLDVVNLFGTARELGLHVERSGWGGVDASGRYREPWILGTPLSATLRLAQAIPDSGWLNREAELEAGWELREDLEIRAGAGTWRGYEPGDVERSYDYGLAGLGWTPGRRTRQGWSGLVMDFEARLGTLSGPDSSGVLSSAGLEARGDWYFGVAGLGGGFSVGGVVEGAVLESRLRRLGGQKTLRGYAENSFRASRWVVLRPEVSLGETDTRLYAFWDVAALETSGGWEHPSGAGLGIRGRSGLFRADAAVGIPLRGGPARFYLSAVANVF